MKKATKHHREHMFALFFLAFSHYNDGRAEKLTKIMFDGIAGDVKNR
jgi:hypothetical protein